jgi:hypothetical protein
VGSARPGGARTRENALSHGDEACAVDFAGPPKSTRRNGLHYCSHSCRYQMRLASRHAGSCEGMLLNLASAETHVASGPEARSRNKPACLNAFDPRLLVGPSGP